MPWNQKTNVISLKRNDSIKILYNVFFYVSAFTQHDITYTSGIIPLIKLKYKNEQFTVHSVIYQIMQTEKVSTHHVEVNN